MTLKIHIVLALDRHQYVAVINLFIYVSKIALWTSRVAIKITTVIYQRKIQKGKPAN
jgi:hypothetical protein